MRIGLTKAERALQKHSSRTGSSFSTNATIASQYNQEGINIVKQILNDPNKIVTPNKLGGIDIYKPNGQGIRFWKDGSMKGLLEPTKRVK